MPHPNGPPLTALLIAGTLLLVGCGAGGGTATPGPIGARAASAAAPVPAPQATPAIPTARPAAADTPSLASCPVTRPPARPFVPPSPHPATPPPLYGDRFWYGDAALWTWLPRDGTWQGLRDKSYWWRAGYDPIAEQQPALRPTDERLDAPAPPFDNGGRATNGWRDDIGPFMLTMVDLPTPGCWAITARYGTAELRFVVWIAPLPPR